MLPKNIPNTLHPNLTLEKGQIIRIILLLPQASPESIHVTHRLDNTLINRHRRSLIALIPAVGTLDLLRACT
jgi:hypothetical protein